MGFRLSHRLYPAVPPIVVALLAALPVAFAAEAPPAEPPLFVSQVAEMPALTQLFQQQSGWVGADGAYSVKIDPETTLWTFGDTFIGKIRDDERIDCRMINNSAAWQSIKERDKPLRFIWGAGGRKPESLFKGEPDGEYYWPGDGATVDGKLYLFLHRIRPKADGSPLFRFEENGDSLLQIDNPTQAAPKWQVTAVDLENRSSHIKYGVACLVEGDYLYSFCSFPPAGSGLNKQPLVVARMSKENLARLDHSAWEYWCYHGHEKGKAAGCWSHELANPILLFPDAAPEMSVGRVPGIPGLVATYMPAFSNKIVVRHAMAPEGPWSDPISLMQLPPLPKGVISYSAKAHAELSEGEGDLVVTYCRNTEETGGHERNAHVYFPQAVRASLRYRGPQLGSCNCPHPTPPLD